MDVLRTTATPRTGEQEPHGRAAGGPPAGPLVALVALAIAGALHVVAAVEQRGSSDQLVGYFLVLALGQLATAAWLAVGTATTRRPRVWPVTVALAGTVVLVALHLVAHTTDLGTELASPGAIPGGHDHGVPVEGPGLLGTATVAFQLVAMTALLDLLPPRLRRRATDGILVLGASAWVLWWTGVLA